VLLPFQFKSFLEVVRTRLASIEGAIQKGIENIGTKIDAATHAYTIEQNKAKPNPTLNATLSRAQTEIDQENARIEREKKAEQRDRWKNPLAVATLLCTVILTTANIGVLFYYAKQLEQMKLATEESAQSADAAIAAVDLQDIQMRQNRLTEARQERIQSETLRQNQRQATDTLAQIEKQTAIQGIAAKAAESAANTASAQLTMAQNQFEITQRPWIQVSAIPTQLAWEIPDGKKIKIPGINLRFQILARNIGNIPASSVYFTLGAVEPFPPSAAGNQSPFAYLKKREMDSCAAMIKDVPGSPGRYYVAKDLYPNQPMERIQDIGGPLYIGTNNGTIALSGCLIFRYQSSTQVHQRGFIFLLMKKGENGKAPVPFAFPEEVPVNQLVFSDYSGEAYSD
jgi:hypothetical protein